MSKTVPSRNLKFLHVIQSQRFVLGVRWTSVQAERPIEVGLNGPPKTGDASDHTRAGAKFLVLSVGLARMTDALGGPDHVWTEVLAQRLNDDGSFNPDGEKIKFKADSYFCDPECIREVTLVGSMHLTFVSAE